MYFHIDESGNTGNNLFDADQPRLSYGVLSGLTNVDVLGGPLHRKMLETLGEGSLHANELGVAGLTRIAPQLIALQEKMKFDFDYYFIDKTTYALVILFDAVFDAGLNEAVRWDHYWTPYRFLLIYKLTAILDEEILRKAWSLSIERRIERRQQEVVDILEELRARLLNSELDERSKVIMSDAFAFGIANPSRLDFGCSDQKIVSPNAVCFQFVVSAMAARIRKKKLKNASSIIVDQQKEFNNAQIGTHYNLRLIGEGLSRASEKDRQMYLRHPLFEHIGADELSRRWVPEKSIVIGDRTQRIGLQIVDIYLWITNKMLSEAELSPELQYLGSLFLKRGYFDGVSLDGMHRRFLSFARRLPDYGDLTEENLASARALFQSHEDKVRGLGL